MGGALALAMPTAGLGQTRGEIVQPLPPPASGHLSEALRELAANPKNLDALLKAGKASLELGDVDAAVGFFIRADTLPGVKGRAKAGLGAAQIQKKRPVDALQLFQQAHAEGATLDSFAGDVGLAYDLVGDNARAQQFYRTALLEGEDDAILRRLALSQAIAGNQAASEATLLPMLQRQDLAAYRTRAFALAALGKTDEAVTIAEAVMPASLAGKISPYLRYMPRLTRAQQAAAANFGHFPKADAIGKDDPRIAQFASETQVAPAASASVDGRLVPAGEPLGKSAPKPAPAAATQSAVAAAERSAAEKTGPVGEVPLQTVKAGPGRSPEAPVSSQPSISIADADPSSQELPPLDEEDDGVGFDLGNVQGSRAPPQSRPTGVIAVDTVASSAASPDELPQQNRPASPGPAFEPAAAPAPIVAAAEPTPQPQPEPEPEPIGLAEAFEDFTLPTKKAGPVSGAVDITAFEAPREKEEVKPEPPRHPSRIWVQVATGKNRSALGFDWRRIKRKAADALNGKDAFLVHWNRTNRLVTGPFDSQKEALAFVNTLKKDGLSTFVFTSELGEEVLPLPGK